MGSPPQRVTFTVDPDVVAACVANGRPVPALPSPSLFAIRAACSRVAHMAGAAEQADQILRDLEDMSVMAENGTTADLFTARLLQVLPSLRVGAVSVVLHCSHPLYYNLLYGLPNVCCTGLYDPSCLPKSHIISYQS
jgi:hypothetical protein